MFCVFVVFSLCLIGEWSVSRIYVLFFSSVLFVCSFFVICIGVVFVLVVLVVWFCFVSLIWVISVWMVC